MVEESVCAFPECFENFEIMCEVCKSDFCSKHAKQGKYKTVDNRKQYGMVCLNHENMAISGAMTPNKSFNRLFIQLVGLAILIGIGYWINQFLM